MAADNNLDGAASRDLLEMLDAKWHGTARVTVFLDRAEPSEYSPAPVPGVPEDGQARILELDKKEFRVLETLGEVDSLDPEVIRSFVQRINAEPEEKKAFIFWDHGGPSNFGSDETDGSGSVNLEVMEDILTSPEGEPLRFDVIGFDTCLMGSIAALETFVPFTDVYIASAELEPGGGWDYKEILSGMKEPDMSARDFGALAVSTYEDYYRKNPSATGGIAVTLAAWDTSLVKFDDLASLLISMTDAEGLEAAQVYSDVTQAIAGATPYSAKASRPPTSVDLGDVLSWLGVDGGAEDVAASAAVLNESLLEARIAWGSDDSISEALGLSSSPNPANDTTELFLSSIGEDSEGRLHLVSGDVDPPEVDLTFESRSEGTVDFGIVEFGISDDVLLTAARLSLASEEADGVVTVFSSYRVDEASGHVSLAPSSYGLPLATLTLSASEEASAREDMALLQLLRGELSLAVRIETGSTTYDALLLLNDALEPLGVAFENEADGTSAVLTWEEVLAHRDLIITPLLAEVAVGGTELTLVPGRPRPLSEVTLGVANLSDETGLSIVGTATDVQGLSSRAVVAVP